MSAKQAPMAGARNNLITLWKPDPGEDIYGQPLGTYSMVGSAVWADVMPVTQREYTASRQTEAAIDAVIKILYRTDIGATWIVHYDGQQYDIQSVVEIGYHEGTQILVRARQE
jgi:SPP1 family predicted phage head-tail adaptor